MPISKKKVIESASDSSANRGNILTATFLQIRRRLQVISTSILGNSTEAEDALSEAFLRLWKSPRPLENAFQVLAIEAITIAQAIDILGCYDELSSTTQKWYNEIRTIIPFFKEDMVFYPYLKETTNFLKGKR